MKQTAKKRSGFVLLPVIVFIVIIIGSGVVYSNLGFEQPFLVVSAAVAAFFAILAAFLVLNGTASEKCDSFIRGIGNMDTAYIYMTLFLAGSFAQVARASGGVAAVVNLGLSVLPPSVLMAGIFVICAFLGTATGSASGTVATLGPIAFAIGQGAGLNLALVCGCVVSGGLFGDNLSMISDTTIVATRAQGCEMKDKFRMNFFIALPAALVTCVLLLIFGQPESAVSFTPEAYNVLAIVPYLYVLITAIAGVNMFVVLGSGTVLAGIVGLITVGMTFAEFCGLILTGFVGLSETVLQVMFIGGLFNMVMEQGGLDYIISKIRRLIKGRKSAEIGVGAIAAIATVATGANTVALIATGDITRDISREYHIDPRKTASLTDIYSCGVQPLFPYGPHVLIMTGITGGLVAPIEMIPYMWYCMLLLVVAVFSTFVPFADGLTKRDPWNWDKGCSESKLKKAIQNE